MLSTSTMSLMAEPIRPDASASSAGRFVPETLVPACEELEAAFREAWADPAFRAELDAFAARLRRPPSILTECHNLGARARRPPAAQARGPQPHRLAQDQQRARPGAAGQADGQDPARRRDRCRPARRRHRDRSGADGHGVQGLHGCGRRRAPGAQRVPDAAARRRGRGGAQRQPHAQGRRQRGDARLGRDRRRHPLLPRLGDGPAPVSVDGARVPPGDRRRGAARSAPTLLGECPDVVVACVGGGSNAIGIFSGFVDTRRRAGRRRAGRRRGGRPRASPASCTACAAT